MWRIFCLIQFFRPTSLNTVIIFDKQSVYTASFYAVFPLLMILTDTACAYQVITATALRVFQAFVLHIQAHLRLF
jgi:hypothetical protein